MKTALPRNIRFPTAATNAASPARRSTFERASTRKPSASQPKARYTRSENRRRFANSRTKSAAAAPPTAIGTFQAYHPSGRAYESSGQPNPSPEQ